jgi:hypothetical protein
MKINLNMISLKKGKSKFLSIHRMLLLGVKRNPTNSDLKFGKDLLEKIEYKSSCGQNLKSRLT